MAKCTMKQTDGKPKIDPLAITKDHVVAVNDMASRIHKLAKSKGWHPKGEKDEFYIAKTCSNIHAEVSEFFEAFRKDQLKAMCDKAEAMSKVGCVPLTCAEEELADIVIRVFDTAQRLDIDIGKAIQMKSEFNATRPHRHGGKKA